MHLYPQWLQLVLCDHYDIWFPNINLDCDMFWIVVLKHLFTFLEFNYQTNHLSKPQCVKSGCSRLSAIHLMHCVITLVVHSNPPVFIILLYLQG